MDLELNGKVAIVGGGSKGLGRACAETLAAEGARVTICSRSEGDLEKAAVEIRSATGADVLALRRDLPGGIRLHQIQIARNQRPDPGTDREGFGGLNFNDELWALSQCVGPPQGCQPQ